jgi:O-antigen/teichoic acid export membrane protein
LSFGIALLAQSTIGAIMMAFAGRWAFGWATPDATTLERLRFGVPYQGIAFVSLLKDSISPLLIGVLLGAASVGYVEWAQSFAAYVLLAMMTLQGLYLPTFSRVAVYPERLREFFEAVIHATNAVAAPIAITCLVFAKPITLTVFGPRWIPALPIFYWIWIANLFVPTATPCLGMLNALGKSNLALFYATVWAITTWVFGVPLVLAFGAVGFGIANALVQLTNLFLYRSTRRFVPFRILRSVRTPWLLAATAGAIAWLVARVFPPDSPALLLADAAVLGLVYAILMVTWERPRLSRIWRLLVARAA